jgi:hypothetical protein
MEIFPELTLTVLDRAPVAGDAGRVTGEQDRPDPEVQWPRDHPAAAGAARPRAGPTGYARLAATTGVSGSAWSGQAQALPAPQP